MDQASLAPFLFEGDDKRSQILRAAMILFLREGFSETSMDAITAEAGVSKATVYAHFKSKDVLFKEIIRQGSRKVSSDFPPLERGQGSVTSDLLRFFGPIQQLLWHSGGHHWHRLVIAEGGKHPDLAQTFMECVIVPMAEKIQGYLDTLRKLELIDPVDTRLAAEVILSLALIRPIHTLLLLGERGQPDRETLEWNVRFFLKGLGAKLES